METLNIEARSFDGSQNAKIRIPLRLVHFGFKIAKLLPASTVERIDQEVRKKYPDLSFEDLLNEGHEALMGTLKDLEIDVQDEKQSCKVFLCQ